MQKNALVTGANGFIGSALIQALISGGWNVTAATRKPVADLGNHRVRNINIGAIDESTKWEDALKGMDVVVHLAARVHVMSDKSINPLEAYWKINVEGTRRLAQKAAQAGARRLIFMSSIKVNGEENKHTYKESDAPAPEDDYGISKMEAEHELKFISSQTDMDYTIIRPPLVYGAGVKANFRALMAMVHRKVPLPLAGLQNRRSLIYIGNLVDSIMACMTNKAAANQTYLVSDDHDLSTTGLVQAIAASLNTRCFLFPIHHTLLRGAGNLVGKGDAIKRLLGSLTVDISKIKKDLTWKPPISVESGLRQTTKWYKESQLR